MIIELDTDLYDIQITNKKTKKVAEWYSNGFFPVPLNPQDIIENFHRWCNQNIDDATWETWARMLDARDDFPILIVYFEGVKFGQKK